MGRACTEILILDHDPITRDYTARIAENDGYLATEVCHAGEAFAALEANKQLKVVVASNQWSNGIDCIALAGTLRCYWPGVAVVLVSEHVFPSDADLPSDAVVLLKPFTQEQLLVGLRTAMLGHRKNPGNAAVPSGLMPMPSARSQSRPRRGQEKIQLRSSVGP